jgi:hypothetical protein
MTGVETEAITLLAAYLPYAGQAAAQTLGANAMQNLWDKIRQIFKRKGEIAESAIQDFESQPSEEEYQTLVISLLKKFSREDSGLKQELTKLVEHVKQDPIINQPSMQVFGNVRAAIQNTGPGSVIIDQRTYQAQQRRGRTQPPLSVQLDALNQILDRFEKERTRVITEQQLADYIEATALRDNIHPVYSKLTLPSVAEGIQKLIHDGRLRRLKDGLVEIMEQEPPPIPIA